MSIKIKLFGDLKKKAAQKTDNIGVPAIFNIENMGIERIMDILKNLSIEEAEVSHIFVNHKYSGLRKTVKAGDTVALFPTNMSLLYKWYYPVDND